MNNNIGLAVDVSRKSGAAAFSGAGLYGCSGQAAKYTESGCGVYRLSNESGTGRIEVYNVFDGLELCYNDLNMAYCCQEQQADKGLIEINYCTAGRYECAFGENSCCYLAAGETAIAAAARKKSHSCFPLGYYRGFTVLINLDGSSAELQELARLFDIKLPRIRRYICTENNCRILRGGNEFGRVFSGLEQICARRESGHLKLRMLELLLLLNELERIDDAENVEYLCSGQVRCAKETAARMTEDLTKHYTVEQLAQRVRISPTALKKCFKAVYGTPVYTYLRAYRLQTAQKLLEGGASVAQAAAAIGYENPNKFASAFKREYGCTPTEYKMRVRLDR